MSTRFGFCGDCRRTTEWRAIVTAGEVECIPCGRRVLAVTFVEQAKPATSKARPVRVGDMVQAAQRNGARAPITGWSTAFRANTITCEPGRAELYIDTGGFGAWLRLDDDREPGLRHADGAPIDVEATLAELRGGNTFGGLKHASISDDGMFVEARAPQHEAINGLVELEEALRGKQAAFEEAADKRNEFYGRMVALGDEAGALRTELTQVKAELCDALRKLERAERKVKR